MDRPDGAARGRTACRIRATTEVPPMDLAPRINQQLNDSARTIVDAAEGLAAPIAAATEAIVGALLADGKVLACGAGPNAALAQYFVAALLHRFDAERPPIGALTLGAELASMASIQSDGGGLAGAYARQVRALGRPGDVLVAIADLADAPEVVAAIDAAREQGVRVIGLGAGPGTDLGLAMAAEAAVPGDIHVSVRAGHPARIREIQLVVLHAMCEGIDALLIGGEA